MFAKHFKNLLLPKILENMAFGFHFFYFVLFLIFNWLKEFKIKRNLKKDSSRWQVINRMFVSVEGYS